jgi:hypothetical protein
LALAFTLAFALALVFRRRFGLVTDLVGISVPLHPIRNQQQGGHPHKLFKLHQVEFIVIARIRINPGNCREILHDLAVSLWQIPQASRTPTARETRKKTRGPAC